MVCYVSPHHFMNAMADMREVLGNRQIAVTRELTKKFEEVLLGELEELSSNFQRNRQSKENSRW